MALSTQTGTVKSVAATATDLAIVIEWMPPPPPGERSYSIPDGPMRLVVAALKVGEAVSVESDSAAQGIATSVKKP